MAINRPETGRRSDVEGTAAAPVAALAAIPASARAGDLFWHDLRGSLNAADMGLVPGDYDAGIATHADAASQLNSGDLPAAGHHCAPITLPENTRSAGIWAHRGLFIRAAGIYHHRKRQPAWSFPDWCSMATVAADYAQAAVRISRTEHLVIDNCQFVGATAIGLQVDGSSGRVERNLISGAQAANAVRSALQNKGLAIAGNEVSACSNGGILVHRFQNGEDGTIVTGNRVFNIGAHNGGTGQWGNGINVFRAGSVMIANNHVSDCAFSAIRSNSGSNVQISGNQCLRSGETAIYSEFEFNGAVITNNIIDKAARGISIANFMQGGRMAVCSGNLIRNIHQNAPYVDKDHPFGIGISLEADTTVTSNVIEGAEKFGMLLGWGPYLRDVVATSNVIRKADTGICVSVVEGAGDTVIAENIISGTTSGAIVGYRWHEAVTGDMSGRQQVRPSCHRAKPGQLSLSFNGKAQ
ncbi:MAG: TIGR03808 family TAT-translocated repetitive protein [Nitratireductor sp.]